MFIFRALRISVFAQGVGIAVILLGLCPYMTQCPLMMADISGAVAIILLNATALLALFNFLIVENGIL